MASKRKRSYTSAIENINATLASFAAASAASAASSAALGETLGGKLDTLGGKLDTLGGKLDGLLQAFNSSGFLAFASSASASVSASASASAASAAATGETPPRHNDRTTAKQVSFHNKLRRRKGENASIFENEFMCEICSGKQVTLEAAHVIGLAEKEMLYARRMLDKDLPMSINDTDNGLLLCLNCHSYYDKNLIRINEVGMILIDDTLHGVEHYDSLHQTHVPWYKCIGTRANLWPSQNTLEFRNSDEFTTKCNESRAHRRASP
jgi:hypothetical protein